MTIKQLHDQLVELLKTKKEDTPILICFEHSEDWIGHTQEFAVTEITEFKEVIYLETEVLY